MSEVLELPRQESKQNATYRYRVPCVGCRREVLGSVGLEHGLPLIVTQRCPWCYDLLNVTVGRGDAGQLLAIPSAYFGIVKSRFFS